MKDKDTHDAPDTDLIPGYRYLQLVEDYKVYDQRRNKYIEALNRKLRKLMNKKDSCLPKESLLLRRRLINQAIALDPLKKQVVELTQDIDDLKQKISHLKETAIGPDNSDLRSSR